MYTTSWVCCIYVHFGVLFFKHHTLAFFGLKMLDALFLWGNIYLTDSVRTLEIFETLGVIDLIFPMKHRSGEVW